MATSTLPPMIISAAGRPAAPNLDRAAAHDPRVLRGAGLTLLLIGTAVLYLWTLSESGWANSYYSAAVQAGSQSWKAFLFGSLDASNAITVDKPPASFWLMALSVRIFGLSSWSILVPQALLGVATVAVLYASVRGISGHAAGLVAGAILALTPVAVLMFKFNNPDALLVFLLTAAGYCTLRASEKASGRWLAGAGVLVGFAFLAKMLQAFLVLPALVIVYLVAAPTSLGRRIKHLLGAFAAMIISLGWWIALVELVPESWRPYVGGSDGNSVLELIFGYNGLGRIFGNGGGPGGGGASFGSYAGMTRLFEGVSGGMIAWLIPAALLLGTFALIMVRRAPRTNGVRAALLVWGGTLLVTGLTFSLMAGTYHDYYTVALAPAVAALVAIGGQVLWSHRHRALARVGLTSTMIVTGATGYALLSHATAPYDTMRWPVVIISGVAALGLLVAHRLPRVLAAVVLGLALVGSNAGPAAYAVQTTTTPHAGSIVTAGPVNGGGGGMGRGGQPRPSGRSSTASSAVLDMLRGDTDSYDWVAATSGAQSAAAYQLATGRPVMAIGGFTGGDPSPTLEQFQSFVAEGRIHYYLSGGDRGGPGGRGGAAAEIEAWVSQNFTATSVDGITLYDLSAV